MFCLHFYFFYNVEHLSIIDQCKKRLRSKRKSVSKFRLKRLRYEILKKCIYFIYIFLHLLSY